MASPLPCKSRDDVAELLGPFRLRQMPAARDDFDLRARHQLLELARVRDRENLVGFTPDYLHRYLHAVQPFVEKRIVHARLPAEPRYGVAVFLLKDEEPAGRTGSGQLFQPPPGPGEEARGAPPPPRQHKPPGKTPPPQDPP